MSRDVFLKEGPQLIDGEKDAFIWLWGRRKGSGIVGLGEADVVVKGAARLAFTTSGTPGVSQGITIEQNAHWVMMD